MTTRIDRDIVIIGAGASGLTAATSLRRAGLTVAVLEARDRVGGRLWTDDIEGATLEIGGQWVSPDQHALKETLAELGLETYSRYRAGENVYINDSGVRTRFEGEIFPVSPETQAEIVALIATLDELVAEVDPDRPWAHPRAVELDRISFAGWLATQTADQEARDNVAMFIAGAMLTKPAHAFSALQALLMAASAGSFSNLVDADFILDERVVGGLQQVPLLLAEQLGDDVHLGQPVRTLRWSDEGVVAVTDGLEVHARRAILALPPTLLSRISFEPALPRRQHQLHQHLSMGLVIKVHAVYKTPFWREDGLSGTAFSPYELVHEAYDNTNFGDDRGTLVGFVSDEAADAVFRLPAEERRARILLSLSHYFGDKALSPAVYYESDWGNEEWTRGAYAASFDLGGLARYGADLRTPVGPIHFSCSDLAGKGYQHVDGAIRMGRDTAAAIAAVLEPVLEPVGALTSVLD
ncbi:MULTISPECIES: NAD(P)/FAD-dependent oxidoreductase [unclassified Cryobacterium]|uniref:flavin monoamine oxidase family protein n=1 Tax=unclassified Cryobacterium TaxID=2649013 RepID=UPI002AB5471C|nr:MULTISPECIES: NAD(P)/FAD-dependent oxidoreductase [unclassified Cryobacterium]MDY7528044.1 NAD(P)/FAD-dependent oxidoreductase [Cryobacterium sp. 10C2]MDY7556199.1 NAD(P)/FAD-dependent oxidoreductase [Cryobacterium sp. 10C3]MEB0002612.1 NAD(P)/FAD-dependent oxidoreductase [Cryobacterium sp. RTC2.1]MEB0200427.1 NAD(P)/FAD-dependent oxidoreductase [Cryobacterium sp. 5I3]MEB0291275.1 NAD(P)/FAD-dependent oxidoreductase [Cryobacterium sp. 10C2]